MSRRTQPRGFTLIELMTVVAIIGVLSSIAVPNFQKTMARGRQAEAKANLKALYSAERAYWSETQSYDSRMDKVGFSPDRGNRYEYRAGDCAISENRSASPVVAAPGHTCVTVDTQAHANFILQPVFVAPAAVTYAGNTPDPTAPGVTGTCPNCAFYATAAGNVDVETVGIDSWFISSKPATVVRARCGNSTTVTAPAGVAYNSYDDVACDN